MSCSLSFIMGVQHGHDDGILKTELGSAFSFKFWKFSF